MGELATTEPIDIRHAPVTPDLVARMSKWPTLPERYRGKPADIHAVIVTGNELGIEPMEALNSLFLVNGQVSMTGKLMSALVHRAGHQLRVKMSVAGAEGTGFRRDIETKELVEVGTVTFTKEDAERADLMEKETYVAYPAVMMTWRAISQLCRIYFADVLSGVAYVPEEVNIEAPLEAIAIEEFAGVIVDGVDLDLENATADVVNALDGDVVS